MRTLSLILCLLLTTLSASLPVAATSGMSSSPERRAPAPASQADPEALPRGCGSVTPPGEELAACCLSGFVFIDGAAVTGAEVTISTARGDQMVLYTQEYSDLPGMATYRLSLSESPLNIQAGETITITARYSSHERTLSYDVQPNSQQVDVVLAKTYADDYVFERQVWGAAELGRLNEPVDVAVDQAGMVYVLDIGNARVQIFDREGVPVRAWGTRGTLPGEFYASMNDAITVDQQGNVYVVEYMRHRLQKFSAEGALIASWGGRGSKPGQLEYPVGVAVDQEGNIYIAQENQKILKFSPAGVWLATWIPISNMGGPLLGRIAFGPDGHLYVTSWNGSVYSWGYGGVIKINTAGELLGTWGFSPGVFGQPRSIGFNAQGQAYLADPRMNVVQLVSSSGELIREWREAQPGGEALKRPTAVAVSPEGRLYVAEQGAHRLLVREPNDSWLLPWGQRGAAAGQFKQPMGIAVAPDGSFYVADRENYRIQHFRADGTWLRSWGSQGSAPGQFNDPVALARRADGTIYVADRLNQRIDRFTTEGQWMQSFTASRPNGSTLIPGAIAVSDAGFIHAVTYRMDWLSGAVDTVYIINPDNTLDWYQTNGAFPKGIALGSDDRFYVSTINGVYAYPSGGGEPEVVNTGSNFREVSAVAVDSEGNLLVTENRISRASKLQPNGTLLSRWAEPADISSPFTFFIGASLGELYQPQGIADGPGGRVYIADTRNDRIQIFRPMTYTHPIATITSFDPPSLGADDTLTMRGMGQDSDETPQIVAYRWTSSQDGGLGTEAVLTRTAASLSPGSHRISLEVQDNEGQWSAPVSTSIFVATPPQVTWTALLYLAGDYPDRGSQFTAFRTALDHLQGSLHNPAIRVAAQVDGPAHGDTFRMLITPGNPPQVQTIALGEHAMDDPTTLSTFIRWGQATFPAQHYYLAVANHGQAIQGMAWDRTSDLLDDGVANDSAYMTSAELGQAIRAEGIAPIHVIHLDACSMNLLEVAYELRPQADVPTQSRILIASQYLGWNFFAFHTYINAIGMHDTPGDVALRVTERYAMRGSEAQVPYTIAALDLGRVEPMAQAVDHLAAELAAHINNDRVRLTEVEQIWRTSPRFESNGDYVNNELDDYVDLLTWTNQIQLGISNPAVKQRAFALITELTGTRPFILAGSNRVGHGILPAKYGGAFVDLSGARGVSIFYPGRSDTISFEGYIDNRLFAFTRATRWPDFLVTGLGVTSPGPKQPVPGPLEGLDLDPTYQSFLPLVRR